MPKRAQGAPPCPSWLPKPKTRPALSMMSIPRVLPPLSCVTEMPAAFPELVDSF